MIDRLMEGHIHKWRLVSEQDSLHLVCSCHRQALQQLSHMLQMLCANDLRCERRQLSRVEIDVYRVVVNQHSRHATIPACVPPYFIAAPPASFPRQRRRVISQILT